MLDNQENQGRQNEYSELTDMNSYIGLWAVGCGLCSGSVSSSGVWPPGYSGRPVCLAPGPGMIRTKLGYMGQAERSLALDSSVAHQCYTPGQDFYFL